MGINVFWQDEKGNPRLAVLDPEMLLSRAVKTNEAAKTSLIRFIDPHGDTTFNQLQIPDLLAELVGAREWKLSDRQQAHLDKVIALVRLAEGQVHTYISILGA